MTSRSPDRAASTLACTASRTELSGTPISFASRRRAAASSSGTAPACWPTLATGVLVHRGIVVDPPVRSTPRQNSRSGSDVVVPGRLKAVIWSHLPGRVSAPPGAGGNLLALHQE